MLSSAERGSRGYVPARRRVADQAGDIWILGAGEFDCGDSRDRELLEKVVGNARVDAAFLNPPYNVRISGHANVQGRHREFALASGEMTDEAFRQFLTETLGAAASVSREGAVHFVCMDWRHMNDVCAVGRTVYGDLLNLCIWNKSNGGMGSLYRSEHELVFVYRVGSAPHFDAVELGRHGRNRTNVWDYASVNSLPAAVGRTPSALSGHEAGRSRCRCPSGRDLAAASGCSTSFSDRERPLIASERCGRRFGGLEIDPAYVDVAIDRWSTMTGGTPRLAERRKAA